MSKKKLKVLILALNTAGGTAQYASQIANGLCDYCKVTAILNPEGPVELYSRKVDLRFFKPKYFSKFPSILNHRKFFKLVCNVNPDIIYDPIGPAFIRTSGVLPGLSKWPLAITIHDPKPHSDMEYFLYNLILRMNSYLADIIFVHGKKGKEQLIDLGIKKEKIRKIFHGVFDYFDNGLIEEGEELNTILFFGKLRPNKGIDRLYDISKIVIKKIPDAKFIVAGSKRVARRINTSIIRKEVKRLKKLQFFEIYDRYIPNEEVESFFRRASMVLLPYYDATQSGIIPIAYHFSKPVIATNVGDLPEVVKDGKTGFLVNSNQEIADKIILLLKDKDLRKKMGKNAYEFAKEHLAWNKIAYKIYKDFKSLINNKNKSP